MERHGVGTFPQQGKWEVSGRHKSLRHCENRGVTKGFSPALDTVTDAPPAT